jgi:hypothetical protein
MRSSDEHFPPEQAKQANPWQLDLKIVRMTIGVQFMAGLEIFIFYLL